MGKASRVAIIGAGIGGLAAAASLRRLGLEARVYERSGGLGEVGAGLQLGPNAMKVLRAIGIEDQVLQQAFEPTNFVSLKWDDASLRFRDPLKPAAIERYGARYATTHRADLHRLLQSLVPESWIRLGAQCTGVGTNGDSAYANFADGNQIEADVIIGADGIRSAVRESLFGADAPRFTQQICWRAMIPIEKVPSHVGPGGSVALGRGEYHGWLGPQGHVICYPIRGGSVLNIFAGRVSEDWVAESWTLPSSRADLIAAYAGWNDALLDMFSNVDECFKWGIYDRDPLASWTRGRVTLLGDAAHPMMPTLAQGAAITLEDSYTIARHLANSNADWGAAVQAYENERRPRAAGVQLQARTQFDNNRKNPPPPPLDRDWIFKFDASENRDAVAPV